MAVLEEETHSRRTKCVADRGKHLLKEKQRRGKSKAREQDMTEGKKGTRHDREDRSLAGNVSSNKEESGKTIPVNHGNAFGTATNWGNDHQGVYAPLCWSGVYP